MSKDNAAAAGLKGVTVALKRTFSEAGILRGVRALAGLNQVDGFDCPGCAWPEPQERSHAEFCENGAKAVAHEATVKRVAAPFFAEHCIGDLAGRSDKWLEAQGRLVEPMFKEAGSDHYRAISWDRAFSHIGQHFTSLSDPNHAVFYTSGRTSNEAAFLYQLFARTLGTNNLPDCSNMCHESSGTGLSETLGIGKGTVGLHDFYQTDAIFVLGQNPGTNHPRMLSALQTAKERGTRIVAINPLRERGLVRFSNPQRPTQLLGASTEIADLYLQVRVGGDIALLKGIMKCVFEAEDATPGAVIDLDFIAEHTAGFEALRTSLAAIEFEELETRSGLSHSDMQAAADIYIAAKSTIACWAMGLTQHQHGVENVREVVNLLLLRGNIGRPGAGVCPVRGHSNVQGDRTMGIWEKPKEDFLQRLDSEFKIDAPRNHGMDTIAAMHAMEDGKVSVFMALGGNFAAATPDSPRVLAGLKNCELTVHVATKLNRTHVTPGRESLLLPCLGRSERDHSGGNEQFVTVEDSMSVVHASRGTLRPASSTLLSEVEIVASIANSSLPESGINWLAMARDYDRIRDRIERVLPGFERFSERLQAEGSFVLPNGPRERRFTNQEEKALLTVNEMPAD
ncbi:MAG: molybdopterin-dependent oxidoreductase alpha subunit, partial [Candidatus Binatia bacterium]